MMERVRTFDILRGIAIFLMLITHGLLYWLDLDSYWLLTLFRLISNTFLVNGFVFVSGLCFGYSWNYQIENGVPFKKIYLRSLKRTFLLFILSFIYNFIAIFVNEYGFTNIWYWYILQTISFSRLLGLILINIRKVIRFIIALIWIFFTPFVIKWSQNNDLFYFLLFNPINADSIMIFFPFFIFGTLFGDLISNLTTKSNEIIATETKKWLKMAMRLAIFLLIMGIFIGIMQPTNSELGTYYIANLNKNSNWKFQTLPLFLIRGSYVWCIYSLGWEILIFIAVFYFCDFKNKIIQERSERENSKGKEQQGNKKNLNILELFGQYSLSIYLAQYLFFIVKIKCSPSFIWMPIFLLLFIFWLFFCLLTYFGKENYSIEYIISYVSK